MKKIVYIVIIAGIVLGAGDAFARKKGDPFYRPQIGVWFGPVTPVYTTYDVVDSNLGAGLYYRINLPYKPLKVGFDVSYQEHQSRGVNEINLMPTYVNLLYRLPIDFPLNFQLKVGAGSCYVKIKPDNLSQRDPMFMTGFEMSFPAGRYINVGLRIDYLLIYEKHLDGARYNGHFVNAGVTLFFNM
jgi:hypothetical protein